MSHRRESTLSTAAVATAATSIAGVILSKLDTGRPAAGFNATSHIVWGDRAAEVSEPDASHTLVGLLLNAGAMWSWAAVYRLLPRADRLATRLAKAAAVSALAYVTDYHVVPKRLTPGFEKRLKPRSLAVIYGVLAASLAVGDGLSRRA